MTRRIGSRAIELEGFSSRRCSFTPFADPQFDAQGEPPRRIWPMLHGAHRPSPTDANATHDPTCRGATSRMETRSPSHLDELEALQDEVLQELDRLNDRIEQLLKEQGDRSVDVVQAQSA